MSRCVRNWALALLAAVAITVCVYRAVSSAWLSDDSFISFRYAENLVQGKGFVYNEGEYVEGYSNLLWTLLIAGATALGISPEVCSKVVGLGSWLALVGFLAMWSWRQRDRRPFMPLAAALVLLMDDYQTWATGGLETSMFAFLSVTGVLLASQARAERRRMLFAGTLLAAAVATRPDGIIFAAAGVAAAWLVNNDVPGRKRWILVSAVALPLILAGAALAAFKLLYYGDLFPSAFYSKSALDPYYSQGLFYVYLFFKKHWFILPLVVLLVVGTLRRVAVWLTKTNLVLLAAFAAFLAYVAHSGGDFMFARRLIPAMPFLFVVLEDLLVSMPAWLPRSAVVTLVLVGVWFPYPIYPNKTDKIRGIANESAYYPQPYIAMRQAQARLASHALSQAPVRAMFEGGMCVFGFYSKLPYLAEMSGLTQSSLAKKPLAARGYIGHEKVPDAQWLTDNNIHFIFSQAIPPVARSEPRRVDEIYFGDTLKATIWVYVDAIMDPLRNNPAVTFVPIEDALRAAQRQIELASYEEAKSLYDFLERFYFQSAGPDTKALADELRRKVDAKRPGQPGA